MHTEIQHDTSKTIRNQCCILRHIFLTSKDILIISDVDGGVGSWGGWSMCSKTCGGEAFWSMFIYNYSF